MQIFCKVISTKNDLIFRYTENFVKDFFLRDRIVPIFFCKIRPPCAETLTLHRSVKDDTFFVYTYSIRRVGQHKVDALVRKLPQDLHAVGIYDFVDVFFHVQTLWM